MAVRAPLPKAGTFKKATRRPRTRDTQIGSDCDAALPSHKGSFVQRGPAKQLHSLVQAQSGDYLRNGLIATTIRLTPGFRGMYRSSVSMPEALLVERWNYCSFAYSALACL
jgi:hypothetical protein